MQDAELPVMNLDELDRAVGKQRVPVDHLSTAWPRRTTNGALMVAKTLRAGTAVEFAFCIFLQRRSRIALYYGTISHTKFFLKKLGIFFLFFFNFNL
eukprot:SAG31_NODE_7324_length_1719_cov_0.947531_1_plen_97_part_00